MATPKVTLRNSLPGLKYILIDGEYHGKLVRTTDAWGKFWWTVRPPTGISPPYIRAIIRAALPNPHYIRVSSFRSALEQEVAA